MQLTKADYRDILDYYEISLPRKASTRALKNIDKVADNDDSTRRNHFSKSAYNYLKY